MSLWALIQKNGLRQLATATVATTATHKVFGSASVANVATVAVANADNQEVANVDVQGSQFIDSKHGLDIDGVFFADDRRYCTECSNLSAGRCLAAWRGEIKAGRHYRPIDDLPRRCGGYAPKTNDPDQRTGKQRWPSLTRS